MIRRRGWLIAFNFLLLLMAADAGGGVTREGAASLSMRLRAVNPAAADTFALALEVAERNEARAVPLFESVTRLAPGFGPGWRELGKCLLETGRREPGLSALRRAVEYEKSPENYTALVLGLANPTGSTMPTESEVNQAASLCRLTLEQAPDDVELLTAACALAGKTDDFEWLEESVDRLRKEAPDEPLGFYYQGILYLTQNDKEAALAVAERGHQLGMSGEMYRALKSAATHRTPMEQGAHLTQIVGLTWVATLALLFLLGSLLSAAALRAARRVPRETGGRARGLDLALRQLYRGVIGTCCLYYYVSQPLLILLVLALTAGLVYLMFMARHLPIKLILILLGGAAVTVYSILRSLFVRGRAGDPGVKVPADGEPRLRAVLDEVAGRVGTRTVTNVYLTPGTEIAVMERGGAWTRMGRGSERCLILGIGALDGLRLRPLKAILAHEYGHFSNRDTAGGGMALAVRRSLMTSAYGLANGGASNWFNPAWIFLNLFNAVFLRVSQGASRLQEVLADRWAASCYGAPAFRQGLSHVIDRSIRFGAHTNSVLSEVIERKSALGNLYTYQPASGLNEAEVQTAVEAAMTREPSPYDSHPRPVDRFAWVEALEVTDEPPTAQDDMPAWGLFDDREAVERFFTDLVRKNIYRQHHVDIPAEAAT